MQTGGDATQLSCTSTPKPAQWGMPRSTWLLLKLLLSVPIINLGYFMQEDGFCLLRKPECGSN